MNNYAKHSHISVWSPPPTLKDMCWGCLVWCLSFVKFCSCCSWCFIGFSVYLGKTIQAFFFIYLVKCHASVEREYSSFLTNDVTDFRATGKSNGSACDKQLSSLLSAYKFIRFPDMSFQIKTRGIEKLRIGGHQIYSWPILDRELEVRVKRMAASH